MNIKVQDYDLPDRSLIEENGITYKYAVWQPDTTRVILGNSNKPETSLNSEEILEDSVRIVKRPSGGEAVILTPKTLVISIVHVTTKQLNQKEYFRIYNNRIIRGLSSLGIANLDQNGISDVTLNGRKILGSSIYKNKERVFYHAVLNITESTELMEKYLKHPPREPKYRRGRTHSQFVTSITAQGYDLDWESISHAIAHEIISPI